MISAAQATLALAGFVCSLEGICLAINSGGFWWSVANFIPPIGTIHGFGHFAGIW